MSANAAMNGVSFDESTVIGSTIFTAVATDMDASDFGVIRYNIFPLLFVHNQALVQHLF